MKVKPKEIESFRLAEPAPFAVRRSIAAESIELWPKVGDVLKG
jgi:hypothetical protein